MHFMQFSMLDFGLDHYGSQPFICILGSIDFGEMAKYYTGEMHFNSNRELNLGIYESQVWPQTADFIPLYIWRGGGAK